MVIDLTHIDLTHLGLLIKNCRVLSPVRVQILKCIRIIQIGFSHGTVPGLHRQRERRQRQKSCYGQAHSHNQGQGMRQC